MTTTVASGASLLAEGQIVADKYRILRLIGRGGMAEVYAAHHEILRQTVALKVLLPRVAGEPGAAARFLNEARAAARIRGENIVAVMDVGTMPDGAAYMVLEYLEGRDLEAHADDQGPLPVAEAVDHVLGALQAIAQAHAMGIVHRDLKPSNLFLARQPDGSSVVKVLDFGISKASHATEAIDGHSTSSQAILGSPCYMAPEQARSAKSVDARADVWAMGIVLYRLLTGKLPFVADTFTELLLAIVQDTPAPMRASRADLPEALDGIVARCLRKDRGERFANVAELAAALQPFGGADAARAVGRISRTITAGARVEAPPAAAAQPPVASAASVPTVSAVLAPPEPAEPRSASASSPSAAAPPPRAASSAPAHRTSPPPPPARPTPSTTPAAPPPAAAASTYDVLNQRNGSPRDDHHPVARPHAGGHDDASGRRLGERRSAAASSTLLRAVRAAAAAAAAGRGDPAADRRALAAGPERAGAARGGAPARGAAGELRSAPAAERGGRSCGGRAQPSRAAGVHPAAAERSSRSAAAASRDDDAVGEGASSLPHVGRAAAAAGVRPARPAAVESSRAAASAAADIDREALAGSDREGRLGQPAGARRSTPGAAAGHRAPGGDVQLRDAGRDHERLRGSARGAPPAARSVHARLLGRLARGAIQVAARRLRSSRTPPPRSRRARRWPA